MYPVLGGLGVGIGMPSAMIMLEDNPVLAGLGGGMAMPQPIEVTIPNRYS
jgi:hypothetical protein